MDSSRGSRVTEFVTGRQQTDGPGRFRGYGDILLVTVLALATLWLAVTFGRRGGPTWLRVPLGFLFVFVLPGYALTAALFPHADTGPHRSWSSRSITGVERLVLSVGLSLAVVPLVNIGLTLLTVDITLSSVLLANGLFTISAAWIAAIRTYSTPPNARFSPSVASFGPSERGASGWSTATLAFAVVLLVAGAGLTAAVVWSGGGDTYSELSIGSPNGDGEAVAEEYPRSLTVGEPETMQVEIGNHERQPVEYTVVVVLAELDSEDRVAARLELDRFTVSLDHGERTAVEHDLEPSRGGESLRVSYLLYADEVPDQPTVSNADRSVSFFADVTEGS